MHLRLIVAFKVLMMAQCR